MADGTVPMPCRRLWRPQCINSSFRIIHMLFGHETSTAIELPMRGWCRKSVARSFAVEQDAYTAGLDKATRLKGIL
jgi:hypothetical protein